MTFMNDTDERRTTTLIQMCKNGQFITMVPVPVRIFRNKSLILLYCSRRTFFKEILYSILYIITCIPTYLNHLNKVRITKRKVYLLLLYYTFLEYNIYGNIFYLFCFFFFNVFLIKMSVCVCLIKKQSSQGLKLFVENICNIDHLAGPFKCF